VTSDRSKGYGRVLRLLAAKAEDLRQEESEFIRMAADTLLFSEEMDPDARTAADQITTLGEHLVESGRWDKPEVKELVSALAACGPVPARVA
jgi:hypothetical protein